MYLLDHSLADWNIVFYKLTHIIKGFLVSDRFHMILERLLINGQAAEHQIGLTQCQGVPFYRIGIVGILYDKFLIQSFDLTLGQRSASVKFRFFAVDLLKNALS